MTTSIDCLRALKALRSTTNSAGIRQSLHHSKLAQNVRHGLRIVVVVVVVVVLVVSMPCGLFSLVWLTTNMQVDMDVEVRLPEGVWQKGVAFKYDIHSRRILVRLHTGQPPNDGSEVVDAPVNKIRVVKSRSVESQPLFHEIREYLHILQCEAVADLARKYWREWSKPLVNKEANRVALGLNTIFPVIIGEVIPELTREVAQDTILCLQAERIFDTAILPDILHEVSTEALEASRIDQQQLKAHQVSMEAVQELVQAVITHNGLAQPYFTLMGRFSSQVVVEHPEWSSIPLKCKMECKPAGGNGGGHGWDCLYQIEAKHVIEADALVDLEDDRSYEVLEAVIDGAYGLSLEEVLDGFSEEEQDAVDDGYAVVSACSRVLASNLGGSATVS